MCTLTLQLGGPNWNVKLGRRDARTASQAAANNGIPPPTSNLNQLISRFNNLGLSTTDLVALSGLISLFFSCLIIFSTFDFILFMIVFVRNILIHETRLNVGLNTCRFVLLIVGLYYYRLPHNWTSKVHILQASYIQRDQH